LTGYLEALIRARLGDRVAIVTPPAVEERGAGLSLRIAAEREHAHAAFEGLRRRGIVVDWREPATIRVAPVPLYNRHEDTWLFVDALDAELA
jgi:kynureninase